MTIHIVDLKFQCIIGILDFERTQKQEVIIDLTVNYNYKNDFINYALVSEAITSHMIESKFFLIEDALISISATLQKKFPLIDRLNLKITKPSIMPNCRVSVSDNYKFNS